jgi:hypothetical protein
MSARRLFSRAAVLVASLAALGSFAGCDDRDPFWDQSTSYTDNNVALGLTDGVAVLDKESSRYMMVSVSADQQPTITPVAIGTNLATTQLSADHAALLVLTRGVLDRRRATDETAALTLIGAGASPGVVRRYPLPSPLSGLSIDPLGTFATVFAASTDGDFVQNPNELLVTRLGDAASDKNPTPVTIRSFGGRPQRLTYTPSLGLPGGQHRLLLVETSGDLGIVDLEDLSKPDITVRLSSSGGDATPAAVAVSDGAPDNPSDARVAVRLANDRNVILLDFLPQTEATSPHAFRPFPNLVDVGGLPTDIRFVRTDGGLRLAALVPSAQSLSLVDPATSATTSVALGAAFDHLSVISDVVDAAASTDVALVWSTSAPRVAVVALGTSVGTPYRSIDKLELDEPIKAVLDVPAPNQHLKILVGSSGRRLFVLDLKKRTAAPIEAQTGARVAVTDDGARVTLLAEAQTRLAVLDLASVHPLNVNLERPLRGLFDIKKLDGGRALVATHSTGSGGLTVLDALAPNLASSREVHGLFLEGHR